MDMGEAIRDFNNTMYFTGRWNKMIYEGSTKARTWNIRDLVAECDGILNNYYEDGKPYLPYTCWDVEKWQNDVNTLSSFIESYKPYIKGMKCHCSHFSQYNIVED